MNRILACVFLSLGSVLLIYGFSALPSVGTAFLVLLRGGQPDQALWFLLAGLASVVAGVAALFRTTPRPAASSRGRR